MLKNIISILKKNKIILLALIFAIAIILIDYLFLSEPNVENYTHNEIYKNLDQFKNETNFKFAIFGDSHYGKGDLKKFKKAVEFVEKENVDLVLTTGDNIANCENKRCKKRIIDWERSMNSLIPKLFPTFGNHDVEEEYKKSAKYWTDYLTLPENGPENFKELTYSFDYGNTHFVILTSSFPKTHRVNDEQIEWLKSDLKNNNKQNTFIFFHESAFPVSEKIDESLDHKEDQRDKLWSVIDKYNVTSVFSGHEHLHSRRLIDDKVFPNAENNIYQFITGNTSYFHHDKPKKKDSIKGLEFMHQGEVVLIVEVENQKVTVNLHSIEGKLLDSFELPEK